MSIKCSGSTLNKNVVKRKCISLYICVLLFISLLANCFRFKLLIFLTHKIMKIPIQLQKFIISLDTMVMSVFLNLKSWQYRVCKCEPCHFEQYYYLRSISQNDYIFLNLTGKLKLHDFKVCFTKWLYILNLNWWIKTSWRFSLD